MLNICGRCTTRFAVGVDHCPQCGNADYYPEGSMAKISVHGGPSFVGETRDEPAVEAETVDAVKEPGADATPLPVSEYETWFLTDLQAECVARGLAKSGNKADLVQRLLDDDAEPLGL